MHRECMTDFEMKDIGTVKQGEASESVIPVHYV